MSDHTTDPTEPAPRWARPNLSLGLMLLALHAALVLGLGTGASRALLLAHFGLFLLWQPVWQGTRRLVPSRALMVVAGGAALAWWGTWTLLGLWLALLFALIGGNVPGMRALHPRIAPLLAAIYLLAVLLTWVVPNIFGGVDADSLLAYAVRFGLPVPLLVILALTGNPRDDSVRSMDLVSTMLLFLMVVVLTLGALFVQQATRSDYPSALAQTVVGIGTVLFIISWLWDPRGGFAGIGQMLTRYFLSMGLPFERWMHSLADLAAREPDPQRFFISREQPGAPNSETHVARAAVLGKHALYHLRPVSGQRHQLRLHLCALGAPILGDAFYPHVLRGPDAPDDRTRPLQLLARELAFDDPYTGQRRQFTSGLELAAAAQRWPLTS